MQLDPLLLQIPNFKPSFLQLHFQLLIRVPACVQFGSGLVQVAIAFFQKLRFQLESLFVLTNLLQKLLIAVLNRV